MHTIIAFNHEWLFRPDVSGTNVPDSSFDAVTIPHTNKVFPHHNFDDREYQFVSTYRKRFQLPEPLNGRRLFLSFDGVMLASRIRINGHEFPEHCGGYTPFNFDITSYVEESGQNLLEVFVDSTERSDIPPFGFTVDYLTFGGIYREVDLIYMPPVTIKDVFVQANNVLADAELVIDAVVENTTDQDVDLHVSVGIYDGEDIVDTFGQPISVPAGSQMSVRLVNPVKNYVLWSLENPQLYTIAFSLSDANNRILDQYPDIRFGFRDIRFEPDGFFLNGSHIPLRGLNRHQTYPYIGVAAPARLQRKDADILKDELGCNIVRTSHYPQSKHFLDRCDEIGLLVFEEIPGWQHIGDQHWQSLVLRDVRSMIERDRNHASIVIWGVRINESWDNHDLYTKTNALARELDPTRPTGGVRYFLDSEFLEDVFTFNDFSNCIQPPKNTPHLVTEYNGHMFPTKSWDNDERRVEHALRHARVQDLQLADPNVIGAIGWCAFDYNTHKEFGAGDRICYHGVMDIFRLPKYAAYFYESQINPEVRPVLRAATVWAPGDRDAGFHNPLVLFSNCETVEVYEGEILVGRFEPDRVQFPHLEYPPFVISGIRAAVAHPFGNLRLVGYLDGQPVREQIIESDGQPQQLVLVADDDTLHADGIDMTRLVFKVVDRYGNVLPYATRVVNFEFEGDIQLIGENPFALVGGQAAFYVKSGFSTGQANIIARSGNLVSDEVIINLI